MASGEFSVRYQSHYDLNASRFVLFTLLLPIVIVDDDDVPLFLYYHFSNFLLLQSNRTCPICRGNASDYFESSSEEQ